MKKQSIIESEFVKKHPEHVVEMQQEMKFGNLEQGDAEKKIAQKYNLPILNKLVSGSATGRWIKMLKVAAPVTSTTAGIATKPRFGRKKKKKELLKAEMKKGRTFQFRNMTINQEFGTLHDKVQKEYIDWKKTCKNLKLADIGITGRGHEKGGGKGKSSLLEHVQFHVNASVQRHEQPSRTGVEFTLKYLDEAILHEDSLLTNQDEEAMEQFIANIKEMWEQDTDPRNIVFTQAANLVRRGKKWVEEGEEKVFGHYRTQMYIDKRKKVDGITEKISAVDSSWYSGTKNDAEPPFYQAIFSNSSLDNKTGGETSNGILGILERYIDSLGDGPGRPPIVVIIKDTGKMRDKMETLKLLTPLKRKIKQLMKNSAIYSGNSGKVVYKGANRLIGQIENTRFKTNRMTAKYLAKINDINLEADDTPLILREIDLFSIIFTKATLDNLINEWVRGEGQFKSPSNRPIILATDTTSKLKRYSWYQKYLDAKKVEKKVVKKSWTDMLWG